MKNIVRKIIVVMTMCVLFLPGIKALAADAPVIVEQYTEEDNLIFYVKGVEGDVEELFFQVGNTPCEVTGYSKIKDMAEPIYTLILWDNSVSVMKKYDTAIKEVLLDIIANRTANELFSIATLEKDLTVLNNYTNDYTELKKQVNSVEDDNKSVYIIENLYRCMDAFRKTEDSTFKRIILVSDGSGEAGTGYTGTELEQLLQEYSVPIYTIGVGSNKEGIQYMFSLSRATNGVSVYLDELEDNLSATRQIQEDYEILRVCVKLPRELLDGSTRNSKLSVNTSQGDYNVQCQVDLPFESDVQELELTVTPEPTATPTPEPTPMPEPTVTPEPTPAEITEGEPKKSLPMVYIVAGGAVALVLAVVVILVITRRKTKTKESGNDYDGLDNQIANNWKSQSSSAVGEDSTKSVIVPEENDAADKTFVLRGGVSGGHRLQLTSAKDAAVIYRCTMQNGNVVIGRKASLCNLVITEDRAVSGKHCEIYLRNQKCYIRDLGSTNGTYVDGKRVTGEAEFKSGSLVKLGETEYRVTIE